jgi:hypothetical protein
LEKLKFSRNPLCKRISGFTADFPSGRREAGALSSNTGTDAWSKGFPWYTALVAETIIEDKVSGSFTGKSALTGSAEAKSLLGSSSFRGFLE